MPMILAGKPVPFILSVSFPSGDGGGEISLHTEYATYAEARQALEDLILDHQDDAHDYGVGLSRPGLRAGAVIKYPPTFKLDPQPVGAWSISWLPGELLVSGGK